MLLAGSANLPEFTGRVCHVATASYDLAALTLDGGNRVALLKSKRLVKIIQCETPVASCQIIHTHGSATLLALTSDGRVQHIGIVVQSSEHIPSQPTFGEPVRFLACGEEHAVAASRFRLFEWRPQGDSPRELPLPAEYPTNSNDWRIGEITSGGKANACILVRVNTDGGIGVETIPLLWGYGPQIPWEGYQDFPRVVEEINAKKVVSLSLGEKHAVCCTLVGSVWSWGCGENGELGEELMDNEIESVETYSRLKPAKVRGLEGVNIVAVCCGANMTIIRAEACPQVDCEDDVHYLWGGSSRSTGLSCRLDLPDTTCLVIPYPCTLSKAGPDFQSSPESDNHHWLVVTDDRMLDRNKALRGIRRSERRFISKLSTLSERVSRIQTEICNDTDIGALPTHDDECPLKAEETENFAPLQSLVDTTRALKSFHELLLCMLLREERLSIDASFSSLTSKNVSMNGHDDEEGMDCILPLHVVPIDQCFIRAETALRLGHLSYVSSISALANKLGLSIHLSVGGINAESNWPEISSSAQSRVVHPKSHAPRQQQSRGILENLWRGRRSGTSSPRSRQTVGSKSELLLRHHAASMPPILSSNLKDGQSLSYALSMAMRETNALTLDSNESVGRGNNDEFLGPKLEESGGEEDGMTLSSRLDGIDELLLAPYHRLGSYIHRLSIVEAASKELTADEKGLLNNGERINSDSHKSATEVCKSYDAGRRALSVMTHLHQSIDSMLKELVRASQLRNLLRHMNLPPGHPIQELFVPARQLLLSGRGSLTKLYSVGVGYEGLEVAPPDGQVCLLFSDLLVYAECVDTSSLGRSQWRIVYKISLSDVSDIRSGPSSRIEPIRHNSKEEYRTSARQDQDCLCLILLQLRPHLAGGKGGLYGLRVASGRDVRLRWVDYLRRAVVNARADPRPAPTVQIENGYYTGQWRDGKQHGVGTAKYNDGSIYQGEWQVGVACGSGTFTYPNGDIYSGQFENGLQHGTGALRSEGSTTLWV